MILKKRVRKLLSNKVQELNTVIADIDNLLSEMETEFFRVCIFGSARISENSPFYRQVYDLAHKLFIRGVDIVTGGGPGLMEAANKGAKDGSNLTRSIGLPIHLPFENDANSHLDVKHEHKRFSSRLDEFMRISHAVVITAGGIGTLLELFYTWQLMQVRHIKPRPLILLGSTMWRDLLQWMRSGPLAEKLMSKEDFDMVKVCETVDEVIEYLNPSIEQFNSLRTKELQFAEETP